VRTEQATQLVGNFLRSQTAIQPSRGTHLDDLVNHYEVDAAS
jgi:hypothetical protein